MNNNSSFRRSIIVLLFIFSAYGLFAMGRSDESEPQDVTGLENWDHSIDTSDLPPGEYNILVRGTDRAGNVGVGGPYNIFIDPNIQIPVISISNPIEGSRSGNLVHVVGTSVDDEGVDRVEVAVDEGNYQPAKGAEFWSMRLDSSGWDDGLHTLRARAWDRDGNESPVAEVEFFKDTGKPVVDIFSHLNGSYISGRIVLKGTITDLNGVGEASFSRDGGRTFQPLRISKSKIDGQWDFSQKIDSRDTDDGAHVFWVEAFDSLGSKSRQSFLYYIDNSPPELELLSPLSEDSVNGQISLIGRAEDAVGISSLRYESDNGGEGEIIMSPGNPVWVLPLDYRNFKGKEAKIKMFLTDIVGNQIDQTFKIPLDKEGDLPLPGVADRITADLDIPVLTGMIIDDDGPSGSIEYSLNKGELQTLETSGPWTISFDEAVPGANSVQLNAVDMHGLKGLPVTIDLERPVPLPVIILDDYFLGEESIPWMPGNIIGSDNPGVVTGRVLNAGSTRLSFSINDTEAKTVALKAGTEVDEKTFFIKLPKNVESGRMSLKLLGINSLGTEFGTDTVYYNYLKPETEEGVEPPQYSVPDSKGLYLLYPDTEKNGFIMLGADNYISGWIVGDEIQSARFGEGGGFLKIEIEGNGFRIRAAREGRSDDLVLTVALKNGDELLSKPMKIASDNSSPELKISGLNAGMLAANEVSFSVSANDNTGSSELFYSVNGGASFSKLSSDDESAASISLNSLSDGFIDLVIKAEDFFGNTSFGYYPMLKDTSAPDIEFITSIFDRGAEQITYSGRISDFDGVDTINFEFLPPQREPVVLEDPAAEGGEALVVEQPSEDIEVEESPAGVVFIAELNDDIFYLDVNLTGLGFYPGEVMLTAIDHAENQRDIALNVNVDINDGRPLVGIQVPEEMGVSETGFNLSGLILDKEGVASVLYSINNGPFRDAGSGSIFAVPLGLDDLLDDRNTVSVKAVDVNGLESEIVSRNFLISLEEPEVGLIYPEIDFVVRGVVRLEGVSSDVNGIKSVSVSHDNGNTFQTAEGQEDWTYNLDTRLLNNGISSLLIKAVDNAGVNGYYTTLINVDNEAPELNLSHPMDGAQIRSILQLSGRAVDNGGIASLRIIMTRLEMEIEAEKIENESVWEISSRGTVLEEIDLGGFQPGFYSFRAEAVDGAENISTVSRVIELLPEEIRPPEILAPLPGELLGPYFSVQGHLPDYSPKALLMVDGEIFKTVDVGENGYFRYDVQPDDGYPSGNTSLSVRIEGVDGQFESDGILLHYMNTGLWLSIDNLSRDQYVTDRFVIEGSAGYVTEIEDVKMLKPLQPKNIGFSLDGGMSFENIRIKNGSWEYTLYSEEVPDGPIDLLVQSSNGNETAFSRSRIIMDSSGPEMSLFNPGENERLYGNLFFSGEASDEGGLTDVKLSLREGGKDSYETPSFIQGMYFDASGFGATYFTAGLGLTFMDDNVKLQAQYGLAPKTVIDPDTNLERAARFGGNVFGAKLLANLAQIPFSWLFGPEFSAFSASAALGANFSYFSSNSVTDIDSWGVILAGVVGQLELPKITFEDRSFIKYVSVFWEGQLWLISSDVSPDVVLLPSIGVRLGLF